MLPEISTYNRQIQYGLARQWSSETFGRHVRPDSSLRISFPDDETAQNNYATATTTTRTPFSVGEMVRAMYVSLRNYSVASTTDYRDAIEIFDLISKELIKTAHQQVITSPVVITVDYLGDEYTCKIAETDHTQRHDFNRSGRVTTIQLGDEGKVEYRIGSIDEFFDAVLIAGTPFLSLCHDYDTGNTCLLKKNLINARKQIEMAKVAIVENRTTDANDHYRTALQMTRSINYQRLSFGAQVPTTTYVDAFRHLRHEILNHLAARVQNEAFVPDIDLALDMMMLTPSDIHRLEALLELVRKNCDQNEREKTDKFLEFIKTAHCHDVSPEIIRAFNASLIALAGKNEIALMMLVDLGLKWHGNESTYLRPLWDQIRKERSWHVLSKYRKNFPDDFFFFIRISTSKRVIASSDLYPLIKDDTHPDLGIRWLLSLSLNGDRSAMPCLTQLSVNNPHFFVKVEQLAEQGSTRCQSIMPHIIIARAPYETYATLMAVSEGFMELATNPAVQSTSETKARRFLNIASTLPDDLKRLIAQRVAGNSKNTLPDNGAIFADAFRHVVTN